MFTGIVEGQRRIVRAETRAGALRLDIDLEDLAEGVSVGDSICVRGCCLTVESLSGGVASFHLMAQTLGLTAFAGLAEGQTVNIERSLRVGDRLGGHMVSGHLDGLGRVTAVEASAGQTDISIEIPADQERFVIPQGSIGIDGVSLTIAHLQGTRVTVCLIPHTLEMTTLGKLQVGDPVHLEMDMVGKWMERLLPPR